MRKVFLFCLFFFLLGTFACSSEKKVLKKKAHPRAELLHPLFFQEEISSVLNFPFWLNENVIVTKKISSVSFSYFPQEVTNDLDESENSLPKRIIKYYFNGKGNVIFFQHSEYYEGILIAYEAFDVTKSSNNAYHYFDRTKNATSTFLKKNMYDGIEGNENYLSFKNESSKITVVPHLKNQGILQLEKKIQPKNTDWIIYGAINRPTKRFKINNTVTESNVGIYSYLYKNFPLKTSQDEYPFFSKRNYFYKPSGEFIGFLDSIFIDMQYVSRSKTVLHKGKDQLPYYIKKIAQHDQGQTSFGQIIKINYEFKK